MFSIVQISNYGADDGGAVPARRNTAPAASSTCLTPGMINKQKEEAMDSCVKGAWLPPFVYLSFQV